MPRLVSVEEFGRLGRHLLDGVMESGDSVIIQEGDHSIAILATYESVTAMASVLDLPRWEAWVEEMREKFPEAANRIAKLQDRGEEQQEIDKVLLGFDPSAGVVGSPSGREFTASELRRLAVPINEEAVFDQVYSALLEICEEKERIYPEDLRALAQEKIAEAPQRLRLLALSVQSASGLPATAEVTLELAHGPAMRQERGDGPLDAAFKAIEKLTGLKPEVENFSVVAATKGRDATAEAMIQLNLDGEAAVGAGASTNALEAGVHAYLNALNFLLESRREPAGERG
ncbi:MAG TPA: alpha-isopropylmalate synthase regulatory domain-containing protein [Candidatus Dormibacteraeota bacterium]